MSEATATATDGAGDRDETALAASEIRERIKTLHNSDASTATKNVPDIVRFGNPDAWQLICKASSAAEGWMKSTKALETTPRRAVWSRSRPSSATLTAAASWPRPSRSCRGCGLSARVPTGG